MIHNTSDRTVVTFGDGAFDILVGLLADPPGVLAAVLPQDVTVSESADAHDMLTIAADENGVTGYRTDDDHEPTGEPVTVPWEEINHIHIY